MYKAYNLHVPPGYNTLPNCDDYEDLIEARRQSTREHVKHFAKDGVVDATALEHEWFNPEKPHIFLSHSHHDIELAVSIASALKSCLGIECFIDSFVWGYANDLIRQIDDDYCKNIGEGTYNYSKRNQSTSHVHMMLSGALAKVMDRSECVIFLNSPESIQAADLIRSGTAKTASPWIYHELLMTNLLRVRKPVRPRPVFESASKSVPSNESFPTFEFDAPITHLINLSIHDLESWLSCNLSGEDALDRLYKKYSK